MAKLIYSEQSYADLIKTGGFLNGKWETSAGDLYRSVTFTKDGYILTHGQALKVVNTSATTNNGIVVTNTNGKLKISFGGLDSGEVDILIGAENGNYLTKSVTNGVVKFDHNTPSYAAGNSSLGASISSYQITTNVANYDSYGHITKVTAGTATHLDYITDELVAASKTYYLLGALNNTANSTYYKPKKSTGVYFSTDASNVATFYVPKLVISNGVGAVTLKGSGASGADITLDTYIANKVAEVSTSAMIFKGTINASSSTALSGLSGVVNGDTYKVATAGTLNVKLDSDSAAADHAFKVGDVLIAHTNASGTVDYWSYVPAGDETETFISTSDSNQANALSNASGSVTLGNAALRAVSSGVADGDEKLVTGDQVFEYIKGLGYSTTTGTVTGITPGDGLLNGNNNQTAITSNGTLKLNLNSNTKNTYAGGTTNDKSLYFVSLDKDGKVIVDVPYWLVSGSAADSTSNIDVTAAKTSVFINLLTQLSGTNTNSVASSLKLTAGNGITLASTTSGEITIANSYTSNVTSALYIGNSATGTGNAATNTTAGTSVPYLIFKEGDTYSRFKIEGSGSVKTSTDANGNLTITGTNTWRPVYAWLPADMHKANDKIDEMLGSGITTRSLSFSSTFGYKETSSNVVVGETTKTVNVAEIDIVWAEIAADGTVSYNI